MRPSAATLTRLAAALGGALTGRRVERVWRPGRHMLLLKLSGLAPRRLLIDVTPGHPRAILTERWPDTPSAPDRETLILRNHLEGARIASVAAVERRHLALSFARAAGPQTLTVQMAGRYLNVALFDTEGGEHMRLLSGAPAVDPDAPPLRDGAADGDDGDDDAFFARLDRETWADADRRAIEASKGAFLREARRHLKKVSRGVEAVELDLARADEADRFRHWGELLKTGLHRLQKGATRALVPDWTREGQVTEVPLDSALTPVENMERYFHRYQKFARARAGIEARVLEGTAAVEAARALVTEAEALSVEPADRDATEEALDALDERLVALGWRPPQRQDAGPAKRRGEAQPARPYRRFEAADGTPILVGKGARDNGALTFQVARGADLWLHARDHAGSHVVVPARGGEPSHETLLDAATLAAWHSKARGDAVIDVMWTERKHVRRARGGGPGQVTVSASKNVAVRMDAQRLSRLYATLDADR